MEYGGSMDFRTASFPFLLRTALVFRDDYGPGPLTPARYAIFSLAAVGSPFPSIFAVRPYLLGGLGMATRSDFVVWNSVVSPDGQRLVQNGTLSISRASWALAKAGLGVEIGRHFFVEGNLFKPMGLTGPFLSLVSLGFRF